MKHIQTSFLGALAASCLILASSSAVAADMIGDTIKIERNWPTETSQYFTPITVVNDAPGSFASFVGLHIALSADTIMVTWTGPTVTAFEGSSTIFDGLIFSGFSNTVVGVSTLTGNLPIQQISYTAGSIAINFADTRSPGVPWPINIGDTSTYRVAFSSPVPEVPSTALMISGIIALMGISRRKAA